MATLSRSRSYNPFELSTSNNRDGVDEYDQGDITLHSGVPTPFPSHLIPTQSVPDEPAIAPTETVDTELAEIFHALLETNQACLATLSTLLKSSAQTSTNSPSEQDLSQLVESGVLQRKDLQFAQSLQTITILSSRIFELSAPSDNSSQETNKDLHLTLARFKSLRSEYKPNTSTSSGNTPAQIVEKALLWTRLDDAVEKALSQSLSHTHWDLPPSYETSHSQTHEQDRESLPEYNFTDFATRDDEKKPLPEKETPPSSSRRQDRPQLEQLDRDLETILDQLHLLAPAPQLSQAQRYQIPKAKLDQMELARVLGEVERLVGKGRLDDQRAEVRSGAVRGKGKEKELDKLLDLVAKAQTGRMGDQRVEITDMQDRLDKVKTKDEVQRAAFVEQLLAHSQSGRMHAQDFTMQTLPEFLNSSNPNLSTTNLDPNALISLPEFFKEPPPTENGKGKSPLSKSKSIKRGRSFSAPPSAFAWFKSVSGNASPLNEEASKAAVQVIYVAEHLVNLSSVLITLSITSVLQAGQLISAEVYPSSLTHIVVKAGSSSFSEPLLLPVPVSPGKKEVKVEGDHFTLKIAVAPSSPTEREKEDPSSELMDATKLKTLEPTTFICASCSLPLVHSSSPAPLKYIDLPSEHWAEMVEAWMCHPSQTLSAQVKKGGAKGFWPAEGEAMIGGSYVLFNESSVGKVNLRVEERGEEWKLVRCICGALVGRCKSSPFASNSRTYRLAKYAIRPVSPSADPLRIPLSAFIVGDMLELVHAHASYRFIIHDEEDEKPRILLWLFNPSVRLSYHTRKQFTLPATASIHAAKLMFRLIGPSTPANSSDLKSLLNKYRDFEHAEHLYYPFDICRSLAALLKESSGAYPEGHQVKGLDVGWLVRA